MFDDSIGLTSKKAKERLEKYGYNLLPEKPPPSDISLLIAQIKNPLVYILIAAGIVTFALKDIPDTIIIVVAVATNGILGFIQERKASRALYALKKLVHPTAKVIRDGKATTLDASEVVPGDVAILAAGEKVPADGKIIEANRLFIDEAILTGESVPNAKAKGKKVFMGTFISSGQGKLLIEKTGEKTEIGKIAESIQRPDEDTPLRKQLIRFSKQLSYLVISLTFFVFIVGFLRKMDFAELLKTSVALSVSAIPEGILVGLTIVLAIGMQRILKKRGLVRNLISAETLGGVTTICIDKTGTLTEGKMRVVDIAGDEGKISFQAIIANDLDEPIVVAAFEWAKSKVGNVKQKLRKYKRFDSIPFSSKERFFATLNKHNENTNCIYVNGAPEYLLEWSNIESDKKEEVLNQIDELTKQGKRVMGMARKKVSSSKKRLIKKDVKKNLEWVGIIALTDPIRTGVKEALAKTKRAGIHLIVVTGDYSQTAVSVMHQLGIGVNEDYIILGSKLLELEEKVLSKRLRERKKVMLFARTTPEQKLKIVEALKRNGEVVAMMGDGVNDAPALKRADIGIVVGEATDVAKESADLVLLDSSFATIVGAIEEGRGIFNNVRKIILYLMSDSFEEIIAVVGTIILRLPLPVTAAQILWINLVSDGFPDIALTIDPKEPGLMNQKPRSMKENLVAPWMRELILIISVSGGLIALGLFIIYFKITNDVVLARSVAFATLGVNSLIYVFSVRTLRRPFWKQNPFENTWLNISVIAGLFLQILPFLTPALRKFFSVSALNIFQWMTVFSASLIMFIIIEASKHIFKERLEN